MDTDEGKKIEIYYDGTCRVCNVFAESIVDSKEKDKFTTKDLTKGNLPEGVSFEEAWRDMYVVEEGGVMYKGADAWLRVLEEYPRWRWFAKIGRLPGILQCVRCGYRVFATNRHRIPGMTIKS